MKQKAQRVALSTLIVIAIVAVALALWKVKLVLALVFLAFILAAALRPGIERLARAGIPRGFDLLIHYVLLIGVVAFALWMVVPRAIDQVQSALGGTTKAQIHQEATNSTGIKHDILNAIDKRLRKVPTASELLHPAVEVTLKVFEALLGIFFVLAAAAYWIFERARAVDFVASLLPRPKRKKLSDTWDLIDLKLGAFVRGQALLIVLVGTVLTLGFWAVGEPYFILIGAFAGVVEIVPVIGPISAGVLAVAVIVRRVLGEAVGLSPLLVLVSVTAVAEFSSAVSRSCWPSRSSPSSSPCSPSSSAMSTRPRKTCRPCSSRRRTPRRRAQLPAVDCVRRRAPRRSPLRGRGGGKA